MMRYNLTPFTCAIDDPQRLKHMEMVKAPLKTKFEGKSEQIRIHILEFTRRMQSTGLYQEFQIRMQENDRPQEIPEDDWTLDHPLRWQTANFLENFSAVTYQMLFQERERIDDTLMMIDDPPISADKDGAKELASKQHSMWIAELLDNSWSDSVTSDMSAFEEETKGDGILLFYVFLREYMGYTKEAIIVAEQQLTKEKLALENFDYDITKFTLHARTYLCRIMNAGSPITNQHFILIFSALKEAHEDEFKLIIMQLYDNWRKGQGEGANITIMQILAKADSEYKRLLQLGQWTTKNKTSDLLGLQAKYDILQHQIAAMIAETKNKDNPQPSNRPTGTPKPEENEERIINREKWFYCTNCWSGRRWNKTHKSEEHKRGLGLGRNKNQKQDQDKDKDKDKEKHTSNLASYELGYGSDFQSG
jgi:hypothetical protein